MAMIVSVGGDRISNLGLNLSFHSISLPSPFSLCLLLSFLLFPFIPSHSTTLPPPLPDSS